MKTHLLVRCLDLHSSLEAASTAQMTLLAVHECSVLWKRNKPEKYEGKLYITEHYVCFNSEPDCNITVHTPLSMRIKLIDPSIGFFFLCQVTLFLANVDMCKLKSESSKALADKIEAKKAPSPTRKLGLFSFVPITVRPTTCIRSLTWPDFTRATHPPRNRARKGLTLYYTRARTKYVYASQFELKTISHQFTPTPDRLQFPSAARHRRRHKSGGRAPTINGAY